MVRMQDVADLAQVSIATVSFVANGTKPVAPATREKVEAAMRELGFTRNVLARALATRRSRIIALLFPQVDQRLNSTALRFVQAAAAAASERDHHLVLWPVPTDADALRQHLDGGLVDGVLAMEVQIEDPRVAVLQAAGVPYVLIGRTGDPTGSAFADIDFETSTADGIGRLGALGHRRVALVLDASGAASGFGPPVRVEHAYRAAMARAGSSAVVLQCERSPIAGRALAAELLVAAPGATAALVMNDEAAPGLVRGLQAAGLDVPRDFSLLGLAMSPATAAFSDPVLDHLAAPASELGRAAAIALIDRLEDPAVPPIRTLLPCTPVAGGTLAPAP